MVVKKIVENFVGTSDRSKIDGLGYPYSLNIMPEDTGEGKAVSRVLKTVNGIQSYQVSSFMTGQHKDIPIGSIRDAFEYNTHMWLVTTNGIFRCSMGDYEYTNPNLAESWECYIQATDVFKNKDYKHVIQNDVCFIMDFTDNRLYYINLNEGSLREVVLPKRDRYIDGVLVNDRIVVADIAAAYNTILLADKTSNRIYYSLTDWASLTTTTLGTANPELIFVGYYDYEEKKMVRREDDSGTWFEQTALSGDMRMLFTAGGTLYGVSTNYLQRYDYNSSTTEPFVPNLSGVIHLKYVGNNGRMLHANLDGYEFVFLQDGDDNGGLYLIDNTGIEKISTQELECELVHNQPDWVTTMTYAPNHKLFGAYVIDSSADDSVMRWAVYDTSTKCWHWRDEMPWVQLGRHNAVFSYKFQIRQGLARETDFLSYLYDGPGQMDIVRQGGAIYNNGDSFIVDSCELLTNGVSGCKEATIEYCWEGDNFDQCSSFELDNTTSKCGLAMGMGRTLTIRFRVRGYKNNLASPLIIKGLKISYRPAKNFLRW